MTDQMQYWRKRRSELLIDIDALTSGRIKISTVIDSQVVGSENPTIIANLEAALSVYDVIIAALEADNA